VEVVCPPGILIPGGCEQCTMTDANELVISVDLVDVAQQASSLFLLTQDTPIAIVAWGGEGGEGSNSLFHGGGDGGASGFASTVTSILDFDDSFGQTSLFYYLAQAGTLSNVCGDGGASTLVMVVEGSPSLTDMVLIAGGGGGGEEGGTFSSGDNGGFGGQAINGAVVGIGGQSVDGADGGGNGSGGGGDSGGNDGVGGEGGTGFLGNNSTWLNGDPGVGSNGQGGNAASCTFCDGCGGGGGGWGGGAGGDDAGAGGGSLAIPATQACTIAPEVGSIPSNPGGSNGAVEIWIFTGGC